MTHTTERLSEKVKSEYITDLITDEMVEAALEASYDPPKEPGRTFLNRDSYRSLWKHHMRAALEAAAPAIAAKAWDEGYAEGGRGRMWDSTNPYCADELSERFANQHQTRIGAIKELADLL